MTYQLKDANIRALLDALAERDTHIKTAIEAVGYPPERIRPAGFETFLSAIVGQQVSIHAAAAIFGRVKALMDDAADPAKIQHLSDDALRGAGLSRQKITYVRSLSDHLTNGMLNLDKLHQLDDEAAIKAITQVRGLGRWSAEIYLMFALGRPDVWPVDDLGVQEGVARMLGLEDRPKPKRLKEIGEDWSPARSAVALLAWHYYSNAPLN